MHGTVLNTSHNSFLMMGYIPTSLKRKLRLRRVKSPAEGHTAGKWHSQVLFNAKVPSPNLHVGISQTSLR